MSEHQEAIVLGALTSGAKTLRELQDALAPDAAFGTENAVISIVQSMARRGAIARTPSARRERWRSVAVYSLPAPTKEEALRAEVFAFVRDVATSYDHDESAHVHANGACRRCNAEKLLAKLTAC